MKPTTLSRRGFLSGSGASSLLAALPLALAASTRASAASSYATSSDPSTEIIWMSATRLAQLIREKKVSSKEAVIAFYKRIDDVNPKLNAVVQFCRERALKEADAADAALAAGTLFGPLHGVPMTIKDSFETEGVISTGGTQGREFYVGKTDATAVARLRKAGAILLGKTNTPEFTLPTLRALGTTVNIIYGITKNPYDVTRSTSGSSGGAGSIVAAGGAAFDFGSDFGGSIRLPAHNNGVAGIKPTTGRVPRTGHIVDFGGIFDAYQQVGPLARRVEDLLTIMPIVSGPDGYDAAIAPMPWADPLKVDLKKLRVAFYTKMAPTAVTPTKETVETVTQVVKYFTEIGAQVTEDTPPDLLLGQELNQKLIRGDGNAWQKRLVDRYHTTVPEPGRLFDQPQIPTAEFTEALEQFDAWRSKMLAWVKNYDVIISPTAWEPAAPIGRPLPNPPLVGGSFTSTYNHTGWPSAVVRAGTSPEGLPIGVMVTGQPWREDNVLSALSYIETRTGGWKPPAI